MSQERLRIAFAPNRRWVAELALRQFRRYATDQDFTYEENRWTHEWAITADQRAQRQWSHLGAIVRAATIFERQVREQEGVQAQQAIQDMVTERVSWFAEGFFRRRQGLPAVDQSNLSY